MIQFSIIVPVYNRPQEMEEFLHSLSLQTDKDFEVMVMEDQSPNSCESICQRYASNINIQYYCIHTGRSERRNLGMEKAKGNYFILFDSDCIIPPNYIATLRQVLTSDYVDCFGGPDSANSSFSNTQLAVNYAMTSFLTTGGIRGGMKDVNKFLPRAFNMGFSREVFQRTRGYKEIIGEDIDLSMRIKEGGFSVRLIKEAVVVHKRNVDIPKFFRQVNTFGKARILLSKLHPHSLKITHLFPSCFLLGCITLLILALLSPYFLLPLAVYSVALFAESWINNGSLAVAALSVVTSYAQLFGYGLGFIDELITRRASKKASEQLYRQ